MMVRFSDIINIKDTKKPEDALSSEGTGDDSLRLSDSKILKSRATTGERIPPEPPIVDDGHLEIITYYEKFIESAINVKGRVENDQGISPSPILTDLYYVINNHLIDKLYEYAMSAPEDYEMMMIHTVNVTFTSLKVGKGLGYDTEMLLRLGLAAFLENVGTYKIPENILNRKGKLTEGEIDVIKRHPTLSYEILVQMGQRYVWLGELALQVHERANGSGYPKGLKKEEIDEKALILGLIDTYVAMVKNRPYGEKFDQTDAIKYIIKDAKGLFPQKILKVFLNEISLFPINTFVKLNNKSIGRVVSTDSNQPLRPAIELLYDGLGVALDKQEVIRLAENPLLYVIDSIHERDLPS